MKKRHVQLTIQTGSLACGFMVWVMLPSLIPYMNAEIPLSPNQVSWVTAVPIILGALFRLPLGYWTNRFGARIIFTISFLLLLLPIIIISHAHSFALLVAGGIFLGIGGALFSIGVTSLPKYFPKSKQGMVNGIYGAGNIGTAFTCFLAPLLTEQFGWRTSIKFYLIIVLLFALINFCFGDRTEPKVTFPVKEQLNHVYKNPKLWLLSLFYFITFGSFIAFTIYLPSFLTNHFNLSNVDAGLRTAGFIVITSLLRPVGGWLGDKFNPFFILMAVFFCLTFAGFLLSFTPSLPIYSFACLLVAIFAGIGNGTIFKLVPFYFSKQAGVVNGIVSAMGALGGFFPPVILTILFNFTGHYAIGFMSLSEFSLASFVIVVWLYYQDTVQISAKIIDHAVHGICITDADGIIQQVNPAFTRITGFTLNEVIGKTPSVLQSGEHNLQFYKNMWGSLQTKGRWEGYIWNKRKNSDIYKEWLTITAIKNDSGDTKNYVGMFIEENELPKFI